MTTPGEPAAGLLRYARNDEENCHCEERSDEAIRRRGRERGFTLVELMVVIVIIGLLATIVIINVMPAADRAATTKARADIATLEQGVEMYRLDNQRYPTSAGRAAGAGRRRLYQAASRRPVEQCLSLRRSGAGRAAVHHFEPWRRRARGRIRGKCRLSN